MLDLTPILRPAFSRTFRRANAAVTRTDTERTQRRVLGALTTAGARTCYGRDHGIRRDMGYEEYAATVPVVEYPDIRPLVELMVQGRRDILWPGVCRRFAQSSGTSDGKSKYIPVTPDSLSFNHYRGARAVVANYLQINPRSRLFSGKAFILGGSFANEVADLAAGVKVGDLSAHLIDRMPAAASLLRVPGKKLALTADWNEKLPALVEASMRADITNISGVPSWFLTVLQRVVERAGAQTVHDVWPNLEVFFHGGIAFGPYRELYRSLTDPARMHYLETYNASEGFFAVQDHPASHAGMRLLLDAGVFYEFVDTSDPDSRPLPAWQLEQGRVYAMLITAPNGLWRYAIGDTVRVDTAEPLRITIAGRTKHFINAFGEEVMVHNTDAALTAACRITGARARDYTAAPVYAHDRSRGRHQWLIEWQTPPADADVFARTLDAELQKVNSDYQAKRAGGLFLDCLTVTDARPGLFDRWLASTGKLGGQRKVPRLANDRRLMDLLLKMNESDT